MSFVNTPSMRKILGAAVSFTEVCGRAVVVGDY
jgi:hypothetical protein